jgi:hypothetical protein
MVPLSPSVRHPLVLGSASKHHSTQESEEEAGVHLLFFGKRRDEGFRRISIPYLASADDERDAKNLTGDIYGAYGLFWQRLNPLSHPHTRHSFFNKHSER